MNITGLPFSKHLSRIFLSALLVVGFAFNAQGQKINKVKYDGEKYKNTCEDFQREVNAAIQSNNSPSQLVVAQYNNSDKIYYYLEPGQFELFNDTLFFRLAKDIPYERFLDKKTKIQVNASYEATGPNKDLESDQSGTIGTLLIDQEYFTANSRPFFLYKLPLNGNDIKGKQISLTFGIAKYKKSGDVKKYFCNTDNSPIGTATPSCCTATPWQPAALQSVVNMPDIETTPASFKYGGFTGTVDVYFQESSSAIDDTAFAALTIQAYVEKYRNAGYKITDMELTGYASPGGTVEYNQKLSEKRAEAVKEALSVLNGNVEGLEIKAQGAGEDWDRVRELTLVAPLTQEEKDQTLAIIDNDSLTLDEKEAQLRPLAHWDTLVPHVLIPARHTFANMTFEYEGTTPAIRAYEEKHPVTSSDLETIALNSLEVKGYGPGANIEEDLNTINLVLSDQADANLYAIRATYQQALRNFQNAIDDLEKASQLAEGENSYKADAATIKVAVADEYQASEQRSLYNDMTAMTEENPGDRSLFFNRAVMMDKIGYISGAMGEYETLLQGTSPTPDNLNNRGVAKLKTNMISSAKDDFEQAVAENDELAQAHFNLAIIAAYRGLPRDCMDHLDRAINLNPKMKEAYMNNPAFSVMKDDPRFDKYK